MKSKFEYDFYRYYEKKWRMTEVKSLILNHSLCFLFLFRKIQSKYKIYENFITRFLLRKIQRKYGLEISPRTSIGKGLYIGHAYNITINPNAILGSNINIHKGVTIGQENRGKRKGSPIIGNKVWIGVNATIVGNILIGEDVLIAPNSYVNIDIPSHSIVIGNPCKIISKEDATKGYINKTV
ncbi:serine acetyltransferase [Clostridium sporogenes]|uniref:serine O-acetyltransferase n=1 Tax=Clostridium sporogenes TaxID=1509 RepID=UPI00313E2B07